MLGDLSSLSDVNEETRARLVHLLSDRNQYLRELLKLNELRITALTNPSEAANEQVQDFNSAVVAPLRDGMSQNALALMDAAIDTDSLKAIMPMVVMGLLQSVNVPLALTTLGLEPDTIENLVDEIRKFIKSGQ